jgi:hypothetical protein
MTGEPRQQTLQPPLSDRLQHNPVRIFPQFIEFAREQQILRRAWPEQDVARHRQPASPERRPAKPAARGQVASRAADAIQDAGGRPMHRRGPVKRRFVQAAALRPLRPA